MENKQNNKIELVKYRPRYSTKSYLMSRAEMESIKAGDIKLTEEFYQKLKDREFQVEKEIAAIDSDYRYHRPRFWSRGYLMTNDEIASDIPHLTESEFRRRASKQNRGVINAHI